MRQQPVVQHYIVTGHIIRSTEPQIYNVFYNQIADARNSHIEVDEDGNKKFLVTCTCRS